MNSIRLPINVRYFHTKPGLTLLRNYGIRESKGNALFFFDDDVDLDANYIHKVEKVFIEDSQHQIGAIGRRIVDLFVNEPIWIERKMFGLIRFVFRLDGYESGYFRDSSMPTHHLLRNRANIVDFIGNSVMMGKC